MNVSSSKVSDLLSCTMLFYLKHHLMLPDETHWKTLCGSQLHNTVEYVLKPKRRALLDSILTGGFTFAAYPSLDRYAKMWRDHYQIALWDHQNMEDMIALTFKTLRPYLNPGEFKSEQRFEIKVDKAVISGYIDILFVGAGMKILDMKTKGKKFAKTELEQNIQAAIYQWYTWRTYGELVEVEFIMTRFPPSKRYPANHLQVVQQPTVQQLQGLENYLVYLHGVMNNFSLEDAHSSYHADESFCHRVCQLKNPFQYISVKKKDTNVLVKNYMMDKPPKEIAADEYTEVLRTKGCPKWNRQ